MDSKHRHELEKNELAKWLTAQYEDWIRPNSSWLGYAVLGILIVVVLIFGIKRVNAWSQNTAWKQYYAALYSVNASTELETLADSTSGAVGVHARLALAQIQLAEGSDLVLTDKTRAILPLEQAIASFQRVQRATSDPMLLQQAGFGLGLAWETLAAARVGDDLARAEEEYQKVVERWGNGFMGQLAQKQLTLIRQPSTKVFLELAATKVPEIEDDFKVQFGADDPFMPGRIDLSPLGEALGLGRETPSEEQQPETE